MKMNLPNKLTILRILLIPFFVFFFEIHSEYIALVIYIVACLTDLADGKIARKYGLVTTFGKFMDPLADKMLVITALILFTADGRLNVIALIIIVAREFIVSGFRLVASDKGIVIAAGMWGKVKTTVQMIMAITLMIHLDLQWFFILEQVLIWASVALTVISLADYIYKNREVLKEEK
jgi:CDP-diacylglycerol--glycerol-3-phosphate 3-phosphatidyltransferase